MTILNFEKFIDKKQLQKGKSYFDDGHITELEETFPGTWEGSVMGSSDYNISITLLKDELEECSCDCPHEVDFCKHIVAALYYIQEARSFESIQSDKKRKKGTAGKRKPSFEEMLNQIPPAALRSFVEKHARQHKDFKAILLAHFAYEFGEDTRKTYSRLIRNAALAAADRSGFIDYYHSKEAIQPAFSLLEHAAEAFAREHYAVSCDIAFTVIEEVHELLENMDDSNGLAGSCIEEAFGILDRLLKAALPVKTRHRIFLEAVKAAQQSKYEAVGFDDHWLQVAVNAAGEPAQQTEVLGLLDKLLSALDLKTDDWSIEYDTVRLLKHKIRLLQIMGKHEEAGKLRLDNLQYHDLRISCIEDLIIGQKYDQAIQLCQEGIRLAHHKELAGRVADLKDILLRIAIAQNNIQQMRQIATELYAGRNMAYYRILKSTYSKEEWTAVVHQLIAKLEAGNPRHSHTGASANAETLASIFVEEQYFPQLLDLLQQNPRLHLVEAFSEHLADRFANELMPVYHQAIETYLSHNTGRNHYRDIRDVLEKLYGWKGCQNKVKEIVAQLSHQYKKRPALLDELRKVFHKH